MDTSTNDIETEKIELSEDLPSDEEQTATEAVSETEPEAEEAKSAESEVMESPSEESEHKEPLLPEPPAPSDQEPEAQTPETKEPEVSLEELLPSGSKSSSEPESETHLGEQPEAESTGVLEEEELLYERQSTTPEVKDESSVYDLKGKWFVVATTSGHEKRAKSNLEHRIQSMNVSNRVFEVVIPLEDQVEFNSGKKVVVQKKVFPGYLLVRCHYPIDDETWHVVRNTPSITGFASTGKRPRPLSRQEVESFLQDKKEGTSSAKKLRPRLRYEVGETVRVREGPFTDFQGQVTEIKEDQLKVKLLLNIFGRETPVELEFSQVAKL